MDQKNSEYGHFSRRKGNIGENEKVRGIEGYDDDDYVQCDQIRAMIDEIHGKIESEEDSLKRSIMMIGDEESQ